MSDVRIEIRTKEARVSWRMSAFIGLNTTERTFEICDSPSMYLQ